MQFLTVVVFFMCSTGVSAFSPSRSVSGTRRSTLQMNFFEDAVKFFSNMNKEASAKHILVKGPGGLARCEEIKAALLESENLSEAFSEYALKFSECPSGKRGGNLGTFKPGMMVKEFDQICFEKEIGVVHGPVATQFGSHLILITRRFEGDEQKK
eukprot:gene3458-6884_t